MDFLKDDKTTKVKRLILKDTDILVVSVSDNYFQRKVIIESIYKQIKKQILPRKNKILILPSSTQLSVIGKEEVEEYISHVDLWSLFDEDGEETGNGV